MIINLLCKAFIAILDILLLDFYLKNIYLDVYKRKFYKTKYFIYILFFLILFLNNNIISYILIHFAIIIILFINFSFFQIDRLLFFKQILLFYILIFILLFLSTMLLSWLFNTKTIVFYSNYSIIYKTLNYLVSYYFVYLILVIFYFKNINKYFRQFQILSILTFISFSFVFILDNSILFRTASIARTYIFTVVISIVALICFDRMQTKYETDKHNKEAIIQNMAKEEEFVQELEKQQLEIRKINHNLNHILIILQSHLKQGEYKEALEYIDKNLDIHIKAYQALTHTGMTMIDSTINHQIYQMKEQNIEYNEDITKILHLGSIVPDDLSLVLGLAFDNAREACEKVKDQRKISLKLQSKQTHIIIHITNSIPRGSHPYFHKTSKKDSVAHGYGVKGIKEIAKKYHGDVKYDVKDDCVVLRIMLQK